MSVDVTKMPKLGFGLMRLPEKNGELDLEQLYTDNETATVDDG